MNIIAGKWKGRPLKYDGKDIRPTVSKVKEALFSILADNLAQVTVLDLFCGSGALGLEALSRGADKLISIDRDVTCAWFNKKSLSLDETWEIYKNTAERAIPILGKRKLAFDLIFSDPPYAYTDKARLLSAILEFGILKPTGLLIWETDNNDIVGSPTEQLVQIRKAKYGQTILEFYKLKKND